MSTPTGQPFRTWRSDTPERRTTSIRRRLSTAGLVALLPLLLSLSTGTAPGRADSNITTQDLTQGLAPSDLAQELAGPGVSISNVTYTGAGVAAGKFTAVDPTTIGFNSGVILSTGCISNVIGPNTEDGATCSNGQPGDPDLTSLAGFPTFDAAVLQFDLVPTRTPLTFEYVFGSEEYNEYSNTQFNDVFAFYVNGANCALVPGTNQPVSVNTINGGNPLGTNPQNPQYYRNNELRDASGNFVSGGAGIDTQLDGLTTVLICTANVTPNATNRIKLAIADGSDSVLDSDVFLKAGSFTTLNPTTTSVTCSPARVPVGSPTTCTATVTDTSGLPTTPTGTVGFSSNNSGTFSNNGTCTLSGGGSSASCSVTYTPSVVGSHAITAAYSGDSTHQTSTSSAFTVTATSADTTPPSCALKSVINGPPKKVVIATQDSDGGLAAPPNGIKVLRSTNATVSIPKYSKGTTSEVDVTATKINQAQASVVTLQVTDQAGNTTTCDPVLTDAISSPGKPVLQTVDGVTGQDHVLTVFNGAPGLHTLIVRVNGKTFVLPALKDNEHATMDIAGALTEGTNSVTLIVLGRPGGSATILFGNI